MPVNTPFGQVSDEALVFGGILVAGGVLLILKGVGGEAGDPPTRSWISPDNFGTPQCASLDNTGQIPLVFHTTSQNPIQVVEVGTQLVLRSPHIMYGGLPRPDGRETFTMFYVIQKFGNVWAAVYGSGIAANDLHANPDGSQVDNLLVNPGQIQPNGTMAPDLGGSVWPGYYPGPMICGGPPKLGERADVILAVYGVQHPYCFPTLGKTDPTCAPDMDGFAAVLCNDGTPRTVRRAFVFKRYPNKVLVSYV